MNALLRDIRHSIRNLIRAPAFAAVAVLLIALGVGATTTLFSLTYGVLMKPLPWPEADRVVRLQETRGGSTGRIPWTISNATYHAWREHHSTIEDVGGWMRSQTMTLTIGAGTPERLRVGRVTPSLMRVLGVRPRLGRVPSDDEAGGRSGPRTVVIGFDVWRHRFAGDPTVIGRTVRLDDRLVTIVGVMPEGFTFPDRDTEAWLPLEIARVTAGADVIQAMIFNAVARLRPGATAGQASSEATARGLSAPKLGSAAVALFGNDGAVAVAAVPARDALTADVRPALVVLLAAVALIFGTAVASVLVLQQSRAVRRRREMAVRIAIGAGSGHIARLWLVESAVIGAIGGAAGLATAAALHRALPAVLPPDFPRLAEIGIDRTVTACAAGLTLLATVLCGLVPMLQLRDRAPAQALTVDATAPDGARSTRATAMRRAMMAAQIAVACVLLVGTGLLARSFGALLAADRGFDPRGVLTAHFTTDLMPFASGSAGLERARERLAALPGVTAAAFGNALPFVTSGGFRGFTMPSPLDPAATVQVQAIVRTVSPEYFAAMGLRLISGRALEGVDTADSLPVVVVNRTFAARYLGPEPIGTMLPMVAGARREWTVVGVVDDLRQGGLSGVAPAAFGGVADPPQPEMFFTYRQWTQGIQDVVFVVRTAADASALGPALRATVAGEAPGLALDSLMTLDDRVRESLARPRTYALLLGGFGVFALAIAGAGLFGVISYLAAERTREIGIRAALGARPGDILWLVSQETAAVLVVGLSIGLGAAFVLARSLTPLLYGVPTHDPMSFVAVPVILAAVAAVACAIPARRAARVNPLVALRHQ